MNKKFGIEIEVTAPGKETIVRYLRAAGINIQAEGYNHITRDYWKVVTDGSVDGSGLELVSPPLVGTAGLKEVTKALIALRDSGAQVNRSCGVHVHFDASTMTADIVKNVLEAYRDNEEIIDGFFPASRRGNNANYCRSLKNYDFSACHTIDALNRELNGRYRKVNLQSYFQHGTIEFRQHSGSVEVDKLVNWIHFLSQLIDLSTAGVFVPETVVAPILNKSEKKVCDVLVLWGFVGSDFIAAQLDVTVATVNKAIKGLKAAGYDIERRANPRNFHKYEHRFNGSPATSVPCADFLNKFHSNTTEYYNYRTAILAS